MHPAKKSARIAGFLYLIVIVCGVFSILFVRSQFVLRDDAAATATNILAHQLRFRWGFAAEIIICCCNIPIALIFYYLFRVVNRNLAAFVVVFSLMGTTIESVISLNHFLPLILLDGGKYLSAIKPEQLQALAYTSFELYDVGISVSLVFFGFYCLVAGYVIFKSTFIPGIIGVLLAIEGLGYLVNSFSLFLAPALQARIFPYFAVTGIAEISFCLWLIAVGVNVPRWEAKAAAAGLPTE